MTDELDVALSAVTGGAGPAPARDGLDDALDQVHGESRMRLAASRLQADGANPDQAAEGLRLGRESGVPDAVAIENVDQLRADSEGRRFERLREESPVLANWLSDPANMAVAKDDVENLSALGKVWQTGSDLSGAFRGAVISQAGSAISGAGTLYNVAENAVDRGARAVFGDAFADAFQVEAPWWMNPTEVLKRPGALIKRYGQERVSPPVERQNFGTDVAAAGGQIAGYVGTQLLTGGGGTVALGATQGADFAQTRADDAGATQEQQDAAASAGAVITSVTERLGVGWLLRRLPKSWTDALALRTADVLMTAGGEAAQEYVENVANNAVAYAVYDPNVDILTPGGEELAAGTAAGLFRAGLLAIRGKSARADEAQRALPKLEQSDQQADASKLRERSPEKFEQAMAAQLDAAGRETVYLPTEQFETFYQSQNVDPAQAWAHLTGDADGYAAARATGADLQIPYAKYLARLTPEERKALTPHLRLSPEAMNAVEAEAFGKDRERILGEALAEKPAEGDAAYDTIYNDLLGQLLNRFPQDVAEKYAAGEATRFVAFAQRAGMDPVAFYKEAPPVIQSEVPETLRRVEFNVEIDPLIERLRAGNVPTEIEVRGPSLLEFLRSKGGIQDQGGELATMDAEQADRAIRTPGQRRLVNPEGLTLDEARELAVGAGYLSDAESDQQATSDISQLLSAIDSELRGTRVYAQGREDAKADADRRTLSDLGDFLAQSGVDLNTTTNEQVKQFLQSGVGPQAMQQQDQTVLEQGEKTLKPMTPDEILDALVAKGLIRDASPEPRTVRQMDRWLDEVVGIETLEQAAYHGSPHDFDQFSLDKIGTGEGAQVYGWGLYFAENPNVARNYITAGRGGQPGPDQTMDALHWAAFAQQMAGRKNAPNMIRDQPGTFPDEKLRAEAIRILESDQKVPPTDKWDGNLYQVDIPDSATARMLDWDKPLSEQPESVRAGVNKLLDSGIFDPESVKAIRQYDSPGSVIYKMLAQDTKASGQSMDAYPGAEGASKRLREAGVPGIRYLDQGSRNKPLKDIKNEILEELPEDAQFDEVEALFGSGKLSPKNETFLKELAANDWLGFDYPAQAISAALKKLSDYETTPELRAALSALQEGGTRNLVVFDDSIVKITHKDGSPVTAAERKEYLQAAADGGQTARAQIRFTKGPNRRFEITLKDADLSSFLHEMGHYWLERMGDVAERADAPQQIKDDYAAILKWMGVEGRTGIGTEQHEMFARANEAYLMEGKAPSIKLRAVFARFKAWMLQVYERLSRLNVSLSPEVRGVFDRLYASQQEIDQARNAQFLKPLWLDRESAGMTEAEWAAYVGATDAARAQAEEDLAVEAMEPIRREEQAWWQDKRKAVAKEVLEVVNRRKDIVALAVLRTGKMPDGAKVEIGKLSKASLMKDFGLTPESLAKLPRGIYTAGEGLSADELAPTFGYASGKELIEALAVVPDKRQLLKEQVEAELKRRYPDIFEDGSVGERAMKAVHGDKAGELLVREAQLLADRAAGTNKTAGLRRYRLTRQMARAAAREVIEATAVRDIRPAKWKAAEAKAGEQAYKLARAGKLAEAAAAKQKQALNHFLYREAVDALEAVEKRVKHLRSLSEKGAREAIGKAGGNEYVATYRDGTQEVFDSRTAAEEAVAEKPGFWFATNTYLEQIDGLLERYDLRVRTNRKLASRESLRAFADRLTADGIPHEIPAEVIADARQVNYRELPYGYFAAVSDAVASIEHVALRKSELIIAGQKRDRDEAAAEIRDSIIGNKPPRLPGVAERGRSERMLDAGNEALSVYLNANYITRDMDGGKAGAVNALLYRPIIEAAVHVDNRKEVVHQAVAAIYEKHYSKAELRAMASQRGANAVPMKEIGEVWTKWDVVSLALNWGNEGNREAILRGRYTGDRRITQAMVDRLLGLNGQPGIMTAKDWAFVADVWKYVDSFWPEIKAKQVQRTGTAPEKVAGSTFQTSTGPIEGGYYPLQYDSRQGGKAGMDAQDDVFEALRTGRFGRAQTKRGHTEARVGSGGRPVTIGMEVLTRHLQNVVYDLEMGDAITSVYKLLEHRGVEQAFTEAGKKAHHRQLRLWLKDVATGEIIASHWAEQLLRFLRVNFTKAVLTFKVSSAALQITGVSQTSAILGPKYTWRGLQQVMTRQPWSAKGWAEQIKAASPSMRARWERGGYNPAVADVMNAAHGKRIPSWVWGAGYWMMGRVQMIADAVTWMGAHAQAVDAGKSPGEALAAADDMVNRAQGSGLFADRSALERGTISENVRQTEFIRAFTVLMSYMMAKGRMANEVTRNTDFKKPEQIARWTVQMAMIFTVEALLVALIRGKWPDDEDDDGAAEEVGMFALKQTALGLVGTVPGLTYLGSEIQGFRGGPPFLEWAENIGNFSKQVEQGELDKALLRAGSDVAGALTGFPSSQANITLDAFWRASEGEEVSPIEYLMRVKKDE